MEGVLGMTHHNVLDHGYVKVIPDGCWGCDEIIIESARMSTQGGFKGWGPLPCPDCAKLDTEDATWVDRLCKKCKGEGTVEGDEKLLRYLWTNKHYTPFEMAGLTIEVQAPIMVFREWHRHRTQSYNEMSGRYTELPDMYYMPSKERLMAGRQSKSNKQGSEEGFSEQEALDIYWNLGKAYAEARKQYEIMLQKGVAREIARLALPVAQYSRMRASANLRNWLAFLSLRLDPAAQYEIRTYAGVVAQLIEERFPRTYALFSGV